MRLDIENTTQEVINFLDKVFFDSKGSFASLLPKVYSEENRIHFKHLIIRNKEEMIVGALLMNTMRYKSDNKFVNVGLIGSVAVHENYRGQGLMRSLMEHSEAYFKYKSCDLVILLGNENLYKHYSYIPIGKKMGAMFHSSETFKRKYDIDIYDTIEDLEGSKYYADLVKLADQLTENYKRDNDRHGQILLSWEQSVVIFTENFEVKGYAVLKRKRDLRQRVCNEIYIMDKDYVTAVADLIRGMSIEELSVELPSCHQWTRSSSFTCIDSLYKAKSLTLNDLSQLVIYPSDLI